MPGTTCYKGCGTEIKFDKNRRSASGKQIPLEMNGEPHQCPNNTYNKQQQQPQPPKNYANMYSGNELSKETRSQKQFEGVDDTIFDKQEFFKRKEEKYDKNVEEYKQWQTDILDISKKTLEAIENLNISIQAFLHPEKPPFQKASELHGTTHGQNEAWSGLDETIQDLGLSEDRPEEENDDENSERQQQGGYPE